MPDHRQHRGAHPQDPLLFTEQHLPALRAAAGDLAWLLERGYAIHSALKLVGDRYDLRERQRTALSRATCSESARARRLRTCLPPESLHDAEIEIDGFNLLITVEAALGGGLIMRCRDECLRDLASMHGSYRAVTETEVALNLIGDFLEAAAPRSVRWLLDSPVSNSGRLAQRIRTRAQEQGWPWQVEVVFDPDAVLRTSEKIVITSDSVVLDHAKRWVNVMAALIEPTLSNAWLIDFRF